MTAWAAKDPDAVLDYVYRIPLDAGDSVNSLTPWVTCIAGTVTIESQSLAGAPNTTSDGYGQDVTVWLSGGANGETSVFRVAWTTSGGRENDDVITLNVIESDLAPLVLTGYMKPVAAHLMARYPAFANVPSATVQYWLTDAERYVTNVWSEGDYAAGLMAKAADSMAQAGLGTDAAVTAAIPTGVSRMKSGAFEMQFTDQAANARLTGVGANRYGQEYLALLQRNRGGPRVAPSGIAPPGTDTFVWP